MVIKKSMRTRDVGEVNPEEHEYLIRRMKQIQESPTERRAYGHMTLDDFVEMLKDEYHGVDVTKRN